MLICFSVICLSSRSWIILLMSALVLSMFGVVPCMVSVVFFSMSRFMEWHYLYQTDATNW